LILRSYQGAGKKFSGALAGWSIVFFYKTFLSAVKADYSED